MDRLGSNPRSPSPPSPSYVPTYYYLVCVAVAVPLNPKAFLSSPSTACRKMDNGDPLGRGLLPSLTPGFSAWWRRSGGGGEEEEEVISYWLLVLQTKEDAQSRCLWELVITPCSLSLSLSASYSATSRAQCGEEEWGECDAGNETR